MNDSLVAVRGETATANFLMGLIVRAALVMVSITAFITLHELAHFVIGRLSGIPAVFTSLTSAGIPKGEDAHQYGGLQLALMNGIAPLLTVIIGFVVYYLLTRQRAALKIARYFFTWWAIFGIPYLGLQLMLVVQTVDYSGNGADSAAVAGYLHLPMLMRAVICAVGFLYYLAAGVLVLKVIRAADPEIPGNAPGGMLAPWQYIPGGLLIVAALTGLGFYLAREFRGMNPGFGLGGAFLGWTLTAVVLTSWSNPTARAVSKRWLLPGIIGMLALIPLGLIGKDGNDYASIWLVILPPVFAAVMFSTLSGMHGIVAATQGPVMRKSRPLSLLIFTAVLALLPILIASQSAHAADMSARRIPVMIVGLTHFESREDVHNSRLADIMNLEHQQQIEAVVRDLARFHPTKVMIEQPYGDSKIVQQYQQYLKGGFKLGANEVYQLGFRLAAVSGNQSIYPVDTNTDFPFDYDGVTAFAKAHGQTPILAANEAHVAALIHRINDLEQHGTIPELLRYVNTPEALDENASWYMYVDRIGSGKDYPGADLVAYWYARNLHIYANIMRYIDSPDDRVVVFMGAGHVPQLREYVRLSPDLESVDPEPFLK